MNSSHQPTHELPSERSFGYLFGAILFIAAVYSLYKGYSQPVVAGLFVLGAIFLATSVIGPALLSPLNKAWFKLGILLGKIVSPIVLGVMFFLLITPIALLLRIRGRDVLGLRRKKDVASYWVVRGAAEPSAASFENQF